MGPGQEHDPYPAYAELRSTGPVVHLTLPDGLRCWLVTRYTDAREALTDKRLSRDPRVAGPQWRQSHRGRRLEDESDLGAHLLTREAPDHTRLRKLIMSAFTVRRAEQLRDRIQQIADELIDTFAADGKAELVGDYAYPLAITVISEILDLPEADRPTFREWTSNGIPGTTQPPSPGVYFADLVERRRQAPGDDLMSELIAAADADRLSPQELLSMLFLLLIAGHEGTVGLVGQAVLTLLGHPEQLELLHREPDRWDAAIEEVLRFDGPMELAAWRFTTTEVTIGDQLIPAGEPVLVGLAAAHRDPARFQSPDLFDIARPDLTHLGFGHGPHYCTGAPLGRVEGVVAVRTLFQRLPDLRLSVAPHQLIRQPSLVIRGMHELPVTFTPQ
ncbi:cytochrome P450 [Pseudonocardiaceae bacterium YIM PH 21723]|nr:cytochrome P450 [Pseudonocardiaceae bacterium YIM PH 21723]